MTATRVAAIAPALLLALSWSGVGTAVAQSHRPRVDVPDEVANAAPTSAPVDAAEASAIDAALHDLAAAADPAGREAAAARVIALGPPAFGALVDRLSRLPATPTDDLRRVLDGIGAQVPDAAGRFADEDTGTRPKKVDWLKALAADVTPADAPAVDTALEVVTLLRAISATRDPRASEALVTFAWAAYDGLFRDECGRQIRAIGDWAIPGLLRVELEWPARRRPNTAAGDAARELAERESRYAGYELDRMDRASPFKALNQSDDSLRIAILQVYGDSRDSDAVSAVLRLCDDDSRSVRAKARWAWMQYVHGHPPKPPKRKMKLPGGKLSKKKEPLYLTYRDLADQAVRDELTSETGQKPGVHERLASMTKRLFSFYDERRAAQWKDIYQQGEKAAAAGDFTTMAARYDWILVHDPFFADRAGMADGFARQGAGLASAGAFAAAATALRRAVDVAPDAQDVPALTAEALRCEAMAAQHAGAPISQVERALSQALALDPGDRAARDALARLEGHTAHGAPTVLYVGGAILALLILAGIVLVVRG